MSKKHFLLNEWNKRHLIKMLMEKLEKNIFIVKQATDTMIIRETIQLVHKS